MQMKVKMKLTGKKRETHDTYTLTFESPDRPDFRPGQFFMLEFMRPEKIPKRSYSVSSSPTRKGSIEFTIKQMPEGWISKLLNDAKPGEEFLLDGPWGHFIFDGSAMKEIVMFSAGSGIAPFRCFCQYIIDKKLPTKATLVYGNKTAEDIICRADLLDFRKKIPGMELVMALSREQKEGYRFGRIDDALAKEIVTRQSADASYFICGPPAMVADVEQLLLANGVAKEKIKTEKYG